MSDLITTFAEQARQNSGAAALIAAGGKEIGFGELWKRARAFGGYCAEQGIVPGDRVIVALEPGIELYTCLIGTWAAGASVVIADPALGVTGLREALQSTGARGFVASRGFRWLRLATRELRDTVGLSPGGAASVDFEPHLPDPDDPALISFTTDRAGRTKAIVRSHRVLMAQHAAMAPIVAGDSAADLVSFPAYILVNLAAGRPSALPDWKMDNPHRVTGAMVAKRINESGATRVFLPPALCEALVSYGLPGQISTIFSGGGPLFPDIAEKILAKRPELRLIAVYGTAEADPIAVLDGTEMTSEDRAAMAAGDGLLVGRPVEALRLRIIEDEICVSGAHVNVGVPGPVEASRRAELRGHEPGERRLPSVAEGELAEVAAPVETAQLVAATPRRDDFADDTAWFGTGDAGKIDAKGRLWLLGRTNAVVPTESGILYPFCIETASRFWPAVRRAALCEVRGFPVLAVEGDPSQLPEWQVRANTLGVSRVEHVDELPMDRHLRSKVDQTALAKLLEQKMQTI